MRISPEQWERVKEIYETALECSPPQRAAFVHQQTKDDDVRAEVLRLLSESDSLGSFLSTPPFIDPQLNSKALLERLEPGKVLAARFRIVRFIAAGGMGEVYEAEDLALRENLAIKTVRPEILQQKNALARFKREVQLARKVTHPNICRVFDLFWHKETGGMPDEGVVFVSMELLQGETLSERIRRRGRFAPEDALPVIEQIASALEAAHRVGIVHRDLKPGNVILVSNGEDQRVRSVVTDFGLALRTKADANKSVELTTSHGLFGTPAYMAPEQIEGAEVTKQTDIYALGLVIYEMVTGKHAFPADTPLASAAKRLSEPLVSPKRFAPELSDAWEQTINRCLERDPSSRYTSAIDVPNALLGQAQDHLAARRSHVSEKRRPFARRLLQTTGALVLIAAMIVGYRLWHDQNQAPRSNLVLRQLTASTADNFIEYALISPDGKYLVYLQKAGALFLNSIETGETRVLLPASGDVFPNSWFPNGSQLLVTKWGSDDSIWKLSVLTGKLTKLGKGKGIGQALVSPKGTHILYADGTGHEIWIMGSEGQEAHRVMAFEPSDSLRSYAWAPTGQRFAYIVTRHQSNGKEETLIETRDIEGRQPSTAIVSSGDLFSGGPLLWLPDKRIIYSLYESPPNQDDSNFWAIKVDPTNGEALTSAQRLTHWVGFDTTFVSATADGKQLAFMKTQYHRTIFIARVIASPKLHLAKVDRLMTDTWGSRVDGWTADSRQILISSNKTGRYAIYRQNIDEQVSEVIITGREDYYDARLSADGASFLYTANTKRGTSDFGRLMSVSTEGGTPFLLARGNYEYQCALPPSKVCVMLEDKKDQRNFYRLDPKVGPASEPFKVTEKLVSWSLSPDGQQIALVEDSDPGRVQIFSMNGGTLRRLDLGKWSQSQSVIQHMAWLPSGNGLYVTAFLPTGTSLLAVTLDGNVTVLFQQGHNWVCCPKVAPNGQLLAFSVSEIERDIEKIDNF